MKERGRVSQGLVQNLREDLGGKGRLRRHGIPVDELLELLPEFQQVGCLPGIWQKLRGRWLTEDECFLVMEAVVREYREQWHLHEGNREIFLPVGNLKWYVGEIYELHGLPASEMIGFEVMETVLDRMVGLGMMAMTVSRMEGYKTYQPVGYFGSLIWTEED